MTVRSRPMGSPEEEAKRAKREQRTFKLKFGLIKAVYAEMAFVALIILAAILLFLVSVVGTYYGSRGQSWPGLAMFWQDFVTYPVGLAAALLGQLVLTTVQWGAAAKRDEHIVWWLFYFASLLVSIAMNWQTFYTPLVQAGIHWLIVSLVLIVGDVITEWVLLALEN